MILKKKPVNFLYWIVTGILFFLFIYLLVKLFPYYKAFISFLWHLLVPFIIAALIAYLLYPIVMKIHRYNIPKGIAILIIYLLFFGGIGYLIYRVYPAIVTQLRDFDEYLPQLVNMYQDIIYQLYNSTSFLPETVHDKIDETIHSLEKWIDALLGTLIGGFSKILDFIIVITVIPVLVFYFLKDYEKINRYVKKQIPSKYRENVSDLFHSMDEGLGGYIRGQLLVCLFVAITSYAIYQFLDLKYALLLAIFMGIMNFVPYFGPIIGAIPAIIIALTVSGKMVLFVLIGVFAIQLIESNLLSPYIVGKSTKVHPVAIIFALLLGGKIGGVIGMVIAVPLLTILRVVIKHLWLIRRKN
ncbi:AI-2E family transporter [Ornithinibacillus halotolerans]|uniref:AI-2E family transporter n=1 Tax=Ornithinibacillus halotolerans TaxID=1274357 RepID=A0A916W5A1_9BACI|nr:AI-2E family transporter [Ornithinibacillus halotolerans]GGA69118.1 AI-2E family transporter [Ornithinibacillus halotolerans]